MQKADKNELFSKPHSLHDDSLTSTSNGLLMPADRRQRSYQHTRQPSSTGQTMIEAGRDVIIHDGTFNQVNGSYTQVIHDGHEPGIHNLSKMIATDAIHDACERYPPPNVHPGTRTKILEVLTTWINHLDPNCRVFWLHGSAGAGKSAILQSLSEMLLSSKGPVVATFFFGRGQARRGSGDYLFSTLAYQLAVNVNGLRTHVDQVMQKNPTLPTKSMEVQLRTLIIEPFQRLEFLPSHIQTVIIDGLDECQGDETQESIIRLIGEALIKHQLPLRFLIASRPEPHIRNGFDSPSLLPISDRLMLHDDFRTRNDIEKYLKNGFADICRRSHSMVHVRMPWPGEGIIETLSRHSCGQFIYATTVLKFVGQKSTYPPKQLDIILSPHPSRGKAFSDLDCLYSQILSTHPDPDTLVRVLSTILAFKAPQPTTTIEEILEMERGEVLDVLQGLHSLLELPDNNTSQSRTVSDSLDVQVDSGNDTFDSDKNTLMFPLNQSDNDNYTRAWGSLTNRRTCIRIPHASFRDYLFDKNRSGVFHVDKTTLDAHISISIFSLTSKWIFDSLTMKIPTSKHNYFTDDFFYEPDYETSHWRHYLRSNLHEHLTNLHNCIGLNRVAAEFEQKLLKRIAKDASYVPFEALYDLIESLEWAIPDIKEEEICRELVKVQEKYVGVLHVCYRLLLPSSNLDTHLTSLPGFGVINMSLPIDILQCIYNLEGEKILSILGEMDRFMDRSALRLSPHVTKFLIDKDSAGKHYYDPIGAHFTLCHAAISLLLPPSWKDIPQFVCRSLLGSLTEFLENHLNAPYTQNVPQAHHTVSLLNHLDRIDYHDLKWFYLRDGYRLLIVWEAIKAVLRWLVKRKRDLCENLSKRCTQVFDKILRQILCLLPTETKSGPIHFLTLLEPFQSLARVDFHAVEVQNHGFFSNARILFPSDQLIAPIFESETPVWFSDDILLLEADIFEELQEYLTNAERAGNFYIDASDYFNQISDVCMERFSFEHSIRVNDSREMRTRTLREHKDYNLVTSYLSYLVDAQASKELYASLEPISYFRWKAKQYAKVLQLLEASPHTPPDLYKVWKQQSKYCRD